MPQLVWLPVPDTSCLGEPLERAAEIGGVDGCPELRREHQSVVVPVRSGEQPLLVLSVSGMAHPGTTRTSEVAGAAQRTTTPPTRIHLVGTPFHRSDLIMSMRGNPLYTYRRYAAEFGEGDLVPGSMAVEATD